MGAAAESGLTKNAAVLPKDLRTSVEVSPLLIGPSELLPVEDEVMQQIREAIRRESKLEIDYLSLDGARSTRLVWPFAIGYFDRVRVLVCWCELRDAFRHFRVDRIKQLSILSQRYPYRKQVLLKQWRVHDSLQKHT